MNKKFLQSCQLLGLITFLSACPQARVKSIPKATESTSSATTTVPGRLDGRWVYLSSQNTLGEENPLQSLSESFQNPNFLEIEFNGNQGNLYLKGKATQTTEECLITIPFTATYGKSCCAKVTLDLKEAGVTESKQNCLNQFTINDTHELITRLSPILGVQRKHAPKAPKDNESFELVPDGESDISVKFDRVL